MAKLKLKGLLLKGVHTLLVKHVQKKLPLKGRVLYVDLEIRWGGGGQSFRLLDKAGWVVSQKLLCSPFGLTLV